jgi:hypothetical protein
MNGANSVLKIFGYHECRCSDGGEHRCMGTKQHGPKDPRPHHAEYPAGEKHRARSVRICPRTFEAEQVTISISIHAKSQNHAHHYRQAVRSLGAQRKTPPLGECCGGVPGPFVKGSRGRRGNASGGPRVPYRMGRPACRPTRKPRLLTRLVAGFGHSRRCFLGDQISNASSSIIPIPITSNFDTTAAARRAGKEALKDLLNKLFA